MSFLNGILLFGALAFAIPLFIHLLNRRKLQEVEWGAVHLLQGVVRKKKRRMRAENFLLLLLRVLIPVILALCLAQPVLTKVRSLGGTQKTSAAILLDDSFSMRAGGADVAAKRNLSELLKKLPQGSEAQLIMMGSKSLTDAPSTDLPRISELLAARRDSGGAADVSRSLQEALAAFESTGNAANEVVIISDFQAADWTGSGRESALAGLAELAIPPEITLFPVSGGESRGNLAITAVTTSASLVGVNQEFGLRVDLENDSSQEQSGLEVSLFADGEPVDSRSLRLGAKATGQVLFRHQFDSPGSHTLEVRTGGDGPPEDNTYHLSMDVRDRILVVLADGDPSNQPLGGEADFLSLALQPFASSGQEITDLIEAKVIDSRALNWHQARDARVLVLANVAKLEGNHLDEIRKWVSEGGSLLCFPGDEADIGFYNGVLFEEGNRRGLFPCKITGLSDASDHGGSVSFYSGQLGHPALAYFNNADTGGLGGVKLESWYDLELPEPDTETGSAPTVMLRSSEGDPLLVEHPYGRGRVIGAAFPCDASWTNLPSQPLYLPLMQRLVAYLATASAPPSAIEVGSPIRVRFADGWHGDWLTVVDPAGETTKVEFQNDHNVRVAHFSDTAAPGIYTAFPKDGPADVTPLRFAVNYGRGESDLTLLSRDEIDSLAESMNAKVVRSADGYAKLDRARRLGQEVWFPFLWLILAFLFGEILLQQWMGRAA